MVKHWRLTCCICEPIKDHPKCFLTHIHVTFLLDDVCCSNLSRVLLHSSCLYHTSLDKTLVVHDIQTQVLALHSWMILKVSYASQVSSSDSNSKGLLTASVPPTPGGLARTSSWHCPREGREPPGHETPATPAARRPTPATGGTVCIGLLQCSIMETHHSR